MMEKERSFPTEPLLMSQVVKTPMKISGLEKTSLIDYPGKIAAVVFTQGCNLRCGFCHNPELIPISSFNEIYVEDVIEYLEKRKNVLDGVVITGGEPTLQKDLDKFMTKIKKLNLLVKLDTNGSNPQVLKKLIDKELIDFIAMDVKGAFENYIQICGLKNTKVIQESINVIINSKIEHEFRTTVLPKYHKKEDFFKIGEILKGADAYAIQGFRPEVTYLSELTKEKRFTHPQLEEFADIMRGYIKNVVIRYND